MSRLVQLLGGAAASPGQVLEDLRFWIKTNGVWWATSATAHMVIFSALLLLMGTVAQKMASEAPTFEAAKTDTEISEPIENFEVGDTPIEPTELNDETLSLTEAPSVEEQINGPEDHPFEEAGGGTSTGASIQLGGSNGFDIKAVGPGPASKGSGTAGKGTGNNAGSGGAGYGFGGRGDGVRKAMLGSGGGTKESERAVAAALNWFKRHQSPDGRWSLEGFHAMCKDPSCTSKASQNTDVAATAFALLPFFASGQTPQSKAYGHEVYRGLFWLMSRQKPTGDLRDGGAMYTHGLAAITLCEAYGLTHDKRIGESAQAAIGFIIKAENPVTGGWHYTPYFEGKTPGDTSVVGWQVMALKSAQMAELISHSHPVFQGAEKWLKSVSSGQGGLFGYNAPGATNTMTAVGLLCSQYLGAGRDDPRIQEGRDFLMKNPPNNYPKDCYYWYYATQVMHNMPGTDWDTWNRQMRRILINAQEKTGCAAGSWNPAGSGHGEAGGRIMVTSLSCLTLEVYYRYLPLYKLDGGENAPPEPKGKSPAKEKSPAVAAKKVSAAKTATAAAEKK